MGSMFKGSAGARSRPCRIRSPRPMPLVPVRTVSRIAARSIASRKASSLRGVAGEFERVALFGDVDDAAAEDVGHALHLVALLADRAHLDEHQFALGEAAFGQVDDLDHLDQPVQVLGDLLDHLVGAGGDDGHARQRSIFGGRDGQAFDVVAARREQRHDARERAGLVFQQHRNDVFHVIRPARSSKPAAVTAGPWPRVAS